MSALPIGNAAYLAYLLVFSASGAGCLVGIWRASQITLPDVRQGMIGLLLTSSLWAAFHVCVLLAATPGIKKAFYQLGLVVGFGTVWAWLWLCSAYSGRSLHRNRGLRWTALSVFVFVTVAKLTNPWHGLYFSIGWASVPFSHLQIDHHVIYWLTTGLSYVLAAFGFFMLAEPLQKAVVGTARLAGLFGLTVLPLGADAAGYTSPYLLDLGHAPIGVAAFALGTLWVYGTRFEEAGWAGQQESPAMVLSGDGRIQNYNQEAMRLYPALRGKTSHDTPVGATVGSVLPELADALAHASGEGETVLEVGDGQEGPRHVRLTESTSARGDRQLIRLTDITEQVRRRREREARLEAISNSIPGAVFAFRAGPEGERSVDFLGEEAGPLLGLSPERPDVFERFMDHVPSSHRERILQSIENAVRGRERWQQEIPYERPDGQQIWLLGSAEPEVQGKQVLYRGTLLDISERKRAEQTLEKERDRLKTLFDSLPTPVVQCEAREETAPIMRANPAFERTFGVAREEAEGTDIHELLVPSAGEQAAAEVDERALSNGAAETEVQRIAKDGLRDFRLQIGGHDPAEGQSEIYAIYTDITERKKREHVLRERREKIEALYEATNQLLQADDKDDLSVRLSSLVDETLNYPATTIRLARGDRLVPTHVPPPVQDNMPERPSYDIDGDTPAAEAYRSGETQAFENLSGEMGMPDRGDIRATAYVPMGSYGLISVGSFEVGGIDSFDLRLLEVLAGYAVLVLDRLDREGTLREAKEEAEEAARMKTALLSNMNHELRTPLTSIISFAEIIHKKPEAAGRFADHILGGGRRLLYTLNTVMEFAKQEGKGPSDNPDFCQPGEIVQSVAYDYRQRAEQEDLDLNVDISGSGSLLIDGDRTEQVLTHLLHNAVKFTDEGEIVVSARVADEAVEIKVSDTGIGMDPAFVPNAFEEFTQESTGLDRTHDGNGLGLTVAKRLVDRMGGDINIESEPKAGTTVTVWVPEAPDRG